MSSKCAIYTHKFAKLVAEQTSTWWHINSESGVFAPHVTYIFGAFDAYNFVRWFYNIFGKYGIYIKFRMVLMKHTHNRYNPAKIECKEHKYPLPNVKRGNGTAFLEMDVCIRHFFFLKIVDIFVENIRLLMITFF